ncbi:MAG TPA: hypothetical protein VKE22_18310 [Haliangiales bacterium]|nr:hypothetical protein [Haliangiales bacterium]
MPRSQQVGFVVAAVAVVVLAWAPGGPPPPPAPTPAAAPAEPATARPRLPPGPDDPHPAPPPEPRMPVPSTEWRNAVAEKVRGTERPGENAFRAFSDLYVDQNLDFARRQAEREGLTLAEVRDLTHFGLLVLATQRVAEVEQLIGRDLAGEERESLASLMRDANDEFKQKMRALVARGASHAERAELIAATEERYRKDFFAITGMNEGLLDDLLAGNILLPGAPAATEPPVGRPPAAPKDDPVAPVRPR